MRIPCDCYHYATVDRRPESSWPTIDYYFDSKNENLGDHDENKRMEKTP